MWFLEGHMDQAISHVLPDINKTLEAFEYWFGPYPFYEDGFKMGKLLIWVWNVRVP